MLKKILVVTLLLVAFPSTAQKIVFGVKGGINWNNIGTLYHLGMESGAGVNANPSTDTYYDADKVMGYQFGGFVMFEWDRFLIRPELNWTKRKNEYPLALEPSAWEQSSTDVSLLLGVKIIKPVSFYFGPSFSWISDMSMAGIQQNLTPFTYDDSSTNIQAGLLIDFKWFGFDLRYEYGFNTIARQRIDMVASKYGTNVAYLEEYNQSTILLTAHINIFRIYPGGGSGKAKTKWRTKNCF